ncbi:MAG: YidC/Oxa1 family membrane protein insertase [Bacilli bacterium]|nr:YidC/Oxa1 family membrane protein insertase [Bacilli bacterium]MDD4053325.1 YidC/Oxa1 family membrane protein insertase [Bacilli bacterium]MDD4411334.1 YidC/Oxa1 family membrane protein insertase [Bacilli bacterium]
MKKSKILILLLIVFSVTGCTTYLKDDNNKNVIYETTGQSLPENILCQPIDKEVIEIYEKHDVNIKELPKCTEYSLSDGGYEGLWNTFFVKPLAWLILKLGMLVKNYGLSLIIIGFLIRLVMYPITKNTAMQSKKMAEAKPEIDKIEKKYKDKTSQEDMMKKSQETMLIYQNHKINPLSSCLFAFLQLPLFFAFLEAINRVPAIFEGTFLTLQLGTTPIAAIIERGQFQYLIIVALLAIVTKYSIDLTKTASINADANNQMAFMNKFLMIFIPAAAMTMSTAISLYWITSSAFTVVQNLLVQRSDK